MPRFLKQDAISLFDAAAESYILCLHGMALPILQNFHKAETKYAPIIGLLGASSELFVKACLVQANGISALYKDADISSGTYRFGSDTIEDLRKLIRDENPAVSYISLLT